MRSLRIQCSRSGRPSQFIRNLPFRMESVSAGNPDYTVCMSYLRIWSRFLSHPSGCRKLKTHHVVPFCFPKSRCAVYLGLFLSHLPVEVHPTCAVASGSPNWHGVPAFYRVSWSERCSRGDALREV
jgi:hypothetical protein